MKHHRGRVEVICGSMFSGKSEELIRRVRRAEIARQSVQGFKPSLDNRYGVAIERARDIYDHLSSNTTVVAIDEAQFFDDDIVKVCRELADTRGMRVIVAGLDLDFRGEPFHPVPELMAQAEDVEKLHAICVVCGDEASRTQRIIDGKPARYSDPVILVGATEAYEARCRHCHDVPDRPTEARSGTGSTSPALDNSPSL